MIDLKDRLDLAMGIADSLKASDSLSGNTIYDLCLHISKAQELVENLTIPVVSIAQRKVCRCYEVPPKQYDDRCDTCGKLYQEIRQT